MKTISLVLISLLPLALQYQCYGVGTVLSMGTDGESFAVWRDASHNGTLPGAAIYTAGIGFGTKDAVQPNSMGFTQVLRPDTPDEARAAVRKQAALQPVLRNGELASDRKVVCDVLSKAVVRWSLCARSPGNLHRN
jgi:hypothetical protein